MPGMPTEATGKPGRWHAKLNTDSQMLTDLTYVWDPSLSY